STYFSRFMLMKSMTLSMIEILPLCPRAAGGGDPESRRALRVRPSVRRRRVLSRRPAAVVLGGKPLHLQMLEMRVVRLARRVDQPRLESIIDGVGDRGNGGQSGAE